MTNRKWTESSVAAAIVAASQNGYCKTVDVGMTVSTMARRLFGSFQQACHYSGVKAWSERHIYTACSMDGCSQKARSTGTPYCETHYYRLRRTGNLLRTDGLDKAVLYMECQHCGRPSNGRKYCGSRCSARSLRGCAATKTCAWCGKEFEPFQKNDCCSKECLRKKTRQAHSEWRLRNIERVKHRERAAEYKRRARKASTTHESIDREYILKRDHYTCKLCGTRVDRRVKWPHPKFATLDHIIPLSKGGTHTKDNVQCAHLSCNCAKNNRARGEQLLLIG